MLLWLLRGAYVALLVGLAVVRVRASSSRPSEQHRARSVVPLVDPRLRRARPVHRPPREAKADHDHLGHLLRPAARPAPRLAVLDWPSTRSSSRAFPNKPQMTQLGRVLITRGLLLRDDFNASADQGRVSLHYPLCRIFQAGEGRPAARPGHQRDHRRPDRRRVRYSIDRHEADRAAVRAAGAAGDRRQLGQAEAEPRPARAGHPQAAADQPEDRTADARRERRRSCGPASGSGWTSGW